jgi:hypothetical protein
MSWNNRIFRHTTKVATTYAIHECHYNNKGKVMSWTVEPMCGHYESVDDLINSLETMLRDAKRSRKDVLEYEPKKRKK